MNKNTKYAIIGIVAVLIILLAFGYFKITGSPTVEAFLNIYQGDVKVDHGQGWVGAADGMDLALDDRVRTEANSEAAVVLHESVIISMDAETEIFIKDLARSHLKAEQPGGSTWNKFTGLAGVEGLSIETPTTVATVRGTDFGVDTNEILVGEGEVEVDYKGQKYTIPAGKKAVLRDGELVIEDLTPEDWAKINGKRGNIIKTLKVLRMREVEKHPFLAQRLKKQYGITDEEIKEYLERADRGEFDLDEVERKSPVKMESVKKIREFTEEIIKLYNLMK
ncbi:FecR family protein [Candidatus Woesearchaeota archaeon]|nr:FecR family protein [Candidatus Woesearchaeota archaeon]